MKYFLTDAQRAALNAAFEDSESQQSSSDDKGSQSDVDEVIQISSSNSNSSDLHTTQRKSKRIKDLRKKNTAIKRVFLIHNVNKRNQKKDSKKK